MSLCNRGPQSRSQQCLWGSTTLQAIVPIQQLTDLFALVLVSPAGITGPAKKGAAQHFWETLSRWAAWFLCCCFERARRHGMCLQVARSDPSRGWPSLAERQANISLGEVWGKWFPLYWGIPAPGSEEPCPARELSEEACSLPPLQCAKG